MCEMRSYYPKIVYICASVCVWETGWTDSGV